MGIFMKNIESYERLEIKFYVLLFYFIGNQRFHTLIQQGISYEIKKWKSYIHKISIKQKSTRRDSNLAEIRNP